jgi:hypothetical protein
MPQRMGRRRRLPRILVYTALASLLGGVLIWSLVVRRAPIVLHPSDDAAQWHRTLTFTLPPEQVVYEEDPTRAARLAALPPDPRTAYVGNPHKPAPPPYFPHGTGDYNLTSRGAEYLPDFYRRMFTGTPPRGLLFMHERVAPGAVHRLILLMQSHAAAPVRITLRSTDAELRARDGLTLTTKSCPVDKEFTPRRGNITQHTILPCRADQIVRIYAGQPDPNDLARFTVRYEIDHAPGTIEGRLQEDGAVSLRIVDGPAVDMPSPAH